MRTLVLWDVDHTLLSVKGLSREIYAEVFQKLTDRPLETIASMAGRTDLWIIAETLRMHGIEPVPGVLRAFTDGLAGAFSARRDEIAARGRVLPGVRAVLEAVAARDDAVQSLLTGNARPIAVHKTTAFGLHPLIDFDAGAYGEDHADRPPLVALAQRRAARLHGRAFDAASTVLVGDTPHDVTAGRLGGARVIAVATGFSTEPELRAAGADIVLPDLTDTEAVLAHLLP
ncbi:MULTISPECIES: HAD family hydrolase [Actinomadura]|uniref:HAD family hydrolase n=1 Tax=Actinomadura yumaensis TaxID=111807 RepID=A0ABW2D2N5_9ACTN|nr:haloacid dehalogenase-like hydrolase [Actinomadura sp. J1-007]